MSLLKYSTINSINFWGFCQSAAAAAVIDSAENKGMNDSLYPETEEHVVSDVVRKSSEH